MACGIGKPSFQWGQQQRATLTELYLNGKLPDSPEIREVTLAPAALHIRSRAWLV